MPQPALSASQLAYIRRLVSRQLARNLGQDEVAMDLTQAIMQQESELPGTIGPSDRLGGVADLYRAIEKIWSATSAYEKKNPKLCPDTLNLFPTQDDGPA